MRNSDTADPFGTQELRARVLQTWRSTPSRLREDANSEEDFARGGYRDRLVVELLQNAADAAATSATKSRVLISLTADTLTVANTGEPLTSTGVDSLASLRASAKQHDGDTSGRFGVGFASVLAITDEPVVRSSGGGVRFSRQQTKQIIESEPSLADTLSQRAGHVPILRLAFSEPTPPPTGYASAVVLPFRDEAARQIAIELVDDIDDALLLGLSALDEIHIEIEPRPSRVITIERSHPHVSITDGGELTRWYLQEASGEIDPTLLADRPTEERRQRVWSVAWAVPLESDGKPRSLPKRTAAVLHAPTPSSEIIELPALLLGTFPLDPSRRHVAAGPLTGFLVDKAASTYAELLSQMADSAGPAALSLVPAPAIVAAFDGQLRTLIRERVRQRPLLRGLIPANAPLSRERAVVVESGSAVVSAQVASHLAAVVDGVVDPAWCWSHTALSLVEPTVIRFADALDALVGAGLPPNWWYSFYESVSNYDSVALEGLPVPLVGGRVVRDVRTCFVPGEQIEQMLALGLRTVDPEAAHPLLGRLGAQAGDPASVLESAELQERLLESRSADEAGEFASAVLALVGDAMGERELNAPGRHLQVPVQDNQWVELGNALLPQSSLAGIAGDAAWIVDSEFVRQVGVAELAAAGALTDFSVETHDEVLLDPDAVDALFPDGGAWVDYIAGELNGADPESCLASEVAFVTGVDIVDDDRWERALTMLTRTDIREAIVKPTMVTTGDGRRITVTSPTAWWLSEAPVFDGVAPTQVRLSGESLLEGLFEGATTKIQDAALLRAIGVSLNVQDLMSRSGGPDELLSRMADSDRLVGVQQLLDLYQALSGLPQHLWPKSPERLRVARGLVTSVVDSQDAVVAVAPHHVPMLAGGFIPGSDQLADVLDVQTSDEVIGSFVPAGGQSRDVPNPVRILLPEAPATYVEHDELRSDGHDLDWWVTEAGVVHAATLDGLARGLAWSGGSWHSRWEIAAVLADPTRADEMVSERAFDR